MSTKSNVGSTSSTTARPTKRRRLASPIELAQPAPEPALVTPDDTVTPASPPLPLTRENLRALTKMSSAGPSTPKAGSAKSGTTNTSRVPAEIRKHLAQFNIFVDELELPQVHASVGDLINRYVKSSRSSPGLSKTEHDAIRGLFREYANATEPNLSDALVDRIFTIPEMLKKDMGFLKRCRDTKFFDGRIPIPDTADDTDWQLLLDQLKIPATPKPDFMFGLKESGPFYQQRRLIDSLSDDIAIATEIHFPFLIVEWKAEGRLGNAHAAESQAARSGSAIVNTMRKLYGKIAPDANPDALPYTNLAARTACFSCVISGWTIGLWVHWFRFVGGVIEWHQTNIFDTRIRSYDDCVELHRAIHNILDWGCYERVTQIQEVLKTYSDQRRADLKRKAPSSSP